MPVTILSVAESQKLAQPGAKPMFVKNYGCQMNEYDGQRMAELMAPLGYRLVDAPDGAELVLLNTCHIREKADDKLFSDIGRFRRAASKTAIIGVGGCVGQAMGAKVMQAAPSVSVVFGPQTYHRLPALIAKVEEGRKLRQNDPAHANAPIRALDTDFPELEKFDRLPAPGVYGPSAFVTIQEGCDKFCTFCVVPYTRGAEISRHAAAIVAECTTLAAQGAVEITLLGQNVNAYVCPQTGATLAKLLEQVGQIDGVQRLRFTTSHPANVGDDLIDAFATNPKLMPYFHLPLQAGSNRILQGMNRSHSVESFLATVAKLKEKSPHVALSGDFIVGFPGETEEDFEETMKVAKEANFIGAYSFVYSARPGTPAAQLADPVPVDIKRAWLHRLQALLDENTAAFASTFVGTTLPVLLEGRGGKPGQLRGRSPHNLPVNVTLPEGADPLPLMGTVVPVRIGHAGVKSLLGEAVLGG